MNTINSRIMKSLRESYYEWIHRIIAYVINTATCVTPIAVVTPQRFTAFRIDFCDIVFIAQDGSRDVSIEAMLKNATRWWDDAANAINGFIIGCTFIGTSCRGLITSTAAFEGTILHLGEMVNIMPPSLIEACANLPPEIFAYYFNSMFPITAPVCNDRVVIVGSNLTACVVNRDAYLRNCKREVNSAGLIYPAPAMSLRVSELLADVINTGSVSERPELSYEEIAQYLDLKEALKIN